MLTFSIAYSKTPTLIKVVSNPVIAINLYKLSVGTLGKFIFILPNLWGELVTTQIFFQKSGRDPGSRFFAPLALRTSLRLSIPHANNQLLAPSAHITKS